MERWSNVAAIDDAISKLNKIKETKQGLMTVINEKGGSLTEASPFSDYPVAIGSMSSSYERTLVQMASPQTITPSAPNKKLRLLSVMMYCRHYPYAGSGAEYNLVLDSVNAASCSWRSVPYSEGTYQEVKTTLLMYSGEDEQGPIYKRLKTEYIYKYATNVKTLQQLPMETVHIPDQSSIEFQVVNGAVSPIALVYTEVDA